MLANDYNLLLDLRPGVSICMPEMHKKMKFPEVCAIAVYSKEDRLIYYLVFTVIQTSEKYHQQILKIKIYKRNITILLGE